MIKNLKQAEVFVLGEKIVTSASWPSNRHYFVESLNIDELGKMSHLYAVSGYLDFILTKSFEQDTVVIG